MGDNGLPPALADVELVDLDPADEAAVEEALRDFAAGNFTTFGSTEEFDAYARQVVADDGQILDTIK